jgi:hypothetical protein
MAAVVGCQIHAAITTESIRVLPTPVPLSRVRSVAEAVATQLPLARVWRYVLGRLS